MAPECDGGSVYQRETRVSGLALNINSQEPLLEGLGRSCGFESRATRLRRQVCSFTQEAFLWVVHSQYRAESTRVNYAPLKKIPICRHN